MANPSQVEVLEDGFTVEITRGTAFNEQTGVSAPIRDSVVASAGDTFDVSELAPGVEERLKDEDPWFEGKLRFLSDKDAKAKEADAEVHEQAQEYADGLAASEAAGEQPIVEGEFNPKEATVQDVQEYLDKVSDEERERVIELERSGKGRTSILDYEPASDDSPEDAG